MNYKSIRLISITYLVIIACALSAPGLAFGQTNGVPLVDEPLVPHAAAPGSHALTLTVNGANFTSGSVVNWNGSPRPTTFISTARLQASIGAADVSNAQTAQVTVTNPGPGGGGSNPAPFEVATAMASLVFSTTNYSLDGELAGDSLATGDFNQDGKLDLAAVVSQNSNVAIFLGNGDGSFEAPVYYPACSTIGTVLVGDFNGDGKPDLAILGEMNFCILLGNGDGTFQAPITVTTNDGSLGAVGDFNRDGKLDLVLGSYSEATVDVFLGNGDGTFQSPSSYATGAGPLYVGVGDFNGDGILDLAVTGWNTGNVSILLGIGDGTFLPHVDYANGYLPEGLALADVDGDGNLDIATGGPDALNVLYGDGQGHFYQLQSYNAGYGHPGAEVSSDLNVDNKLDFAMIGGEGNTVTVLLGSGNRTFKPFINYAIGQNAPALAVGDFNGDGRPDLVVANGVDGNPQPTAISVLIQTPEPLVTLYPTPLGFAPQPVGTVSPVSFVTITNTGNEPLTITKVSITGDFVQKNQCGTIGVGKTCRVGVFFKPTAIGPRTGTLSLTDNAPGSPQTVSLTGTGTVVMLVPVVLGFGNVPVGSTSGPLKVTMTNVGSGTLKIFGIAISGGDQADFAQTNTCGSGVPAHGSCTISVTFTPQATGSRISSVSISDSDGTSPQSVTLEGTGIQ